MRIYVTYRTVSYLELIVEKCLVLVKAQNQRRKLRCLNASVSKLDQFIQGIVDEYVLRLRVIRGKK